MIMAIAICFICSTDKILSEYPMIMVAAFRAIDKYFRVPDDYGHVFFFFFFFLFYKLK